MSGWRNGERIGLAETRRDMMTKGMPAAIAIGVLVAVAGLPTLVAQDAQPARGGANEMWWVNKTRGGVYNPPMRPLWKLSELKQMHAGQNNWQEQIIKDPEQDATYNSAPASIPTRQPCSSSSPVTCVLASKDSSRSPRRADRS
jgi:hypothetical protein